MKINTRPIILRYVVDFQEPSLYLARAILMKPPGPAFTRMEIPMELSVVRIDKPEEMNFILGHAHFIKTVEDLYEAIVQTNPSMKFGLAFCEASGPALVRFAGNEPKLEELATRNAMAIGAGHTFIIMLEDGFPINILNTVKAVAEVCRIHCATANPTEVVIAETAQGRGILGVIDGVRPGGIEGEADIAIRKGFLRKIGYKF